MRIVHTSDWHAGRVWKGIDRLVELEGVLDHLATYVIEHAVDLLLVTGDVFDTGAPPPRAERVVFRFLKRIGQAGTQSVVIAGNHDSPARIEAWGELAELVGVHAVGRPRPADKGGVLTLTMRNGERATVAALPFAGPQLLVSATEMADDDTTAMQGYADKMRTIVALMAERFRPDTVNLLCAHTHLDGAAFSGSERKVHLGSEWAALPEGLPAGAHYVALGHIHKPQRIHAPAPTYYAGSPLQLDFGEAGEEKTFVVIDAVAGQPAKVRHVPYVGGKPLEIVEMTLAQVQANAPALRGSGHLKVVVQLDQADPEVNRNVRRWLDNAVTVDVILPQVAVDTSAPPVATDGSPVELYCAYHRATHGKDPSPALLDRFRALLAAAATPEA